MPTYTLTFPASLWGYINFEPPAPDPPGQLALDDPQWRADYYRIEIAKLQAAVEDWTRYRDAQIEKIENIDRALRDAINPITQQIYECDEKIHRLFGVAIAKPNLGRQSRSRLENAYYVLQGNLISDRRPANEVTEPLLPDETAAPHEEPPDYEHVSKQEILAPKADRQTKERLRTLYLKLASMFHPDKHPGSEHHAQMMQRINIAYDAGDINALLKILAGALPDEASQSDALAESYQALLAQINQLKRAIERLNSTEAIDIDLAQRRGEDPIGQIVAVRAAQLAAMQAPARLLERFTTKKVGLLAFLNELEMVRLLD